MRVCSRSLAFLMLKTWRSASRGAYPIATIRCSGAAGSVKVFAHGISQSDIESLESRSQAGPSEYSDPNLQPLSSQCQAAVVAIVAPGCEPLN